MSQDAQQELPPCPSLLDELPIDAYHALPGASKTSLATLLDRSPAHYRYAMDHPEESGDVLRNGNLRHVMLLEPERFHRRFHVMPDHIRRSIREAPYREQIGLSRGLDYIPDPEEAAELLKQPGKELIKAKDLAPARNLAEAVRSSPFWRRVVERSSGRWIERSLFWRDERWPQILLKSRPDMLVEYGGELIAVDLKTCPDAGAGAFGRAADRFRYGLSAYMFEQATEAVFGRRAKTVLLAAEYEPPYVVEPWLVGTGESPTDWTLLGKRDFEEAMEMLDRCLQRDYWPTRLAGRVEPLPLPRWKERDVNEIEAATPIPVVEEIS